MPKLAFYGQPTGSEFSLIFDEFVRISDVIYFSGIVPMTTNWTLDLHDGTETLSEDKIRVHSWLIPGMSLSFKSWWLVRTSGGQPLVVRIKSKFLRESLINILQNSSFLK